MPPGERSQVWYPELVALLRTEWRSELPWETVVQLRDRLQSLLEALRTQRGILPPLMRCAHCGATGREATLGRRGDGSEIFGTQARALRDPDEHSGPEFLVVMEGEDQVGPALTRESSVRTRLALELPPDSEQGSVDTTSFRGWPDAHAARKETSRSSPGASA